mmetsp:Transcript_99910/g.288495  ORF Transcript_99910/g.288495 Transcript_99910/m.288495 type:complete len:222 (-) Transcript_99910:749-1414(-)
MHSRASHAGGRLLVLRRTDGLRLIAGRVIADDRVLAGARVRRLERGYVGAPRLARLRLGCCRLRAKGRAREGGEDAARVTHQVYHHSYRCRASPVADADGHRCQHRLDGVAPGGRLLHGALSGALGGEAHTLLVRQDRYVDDGHARARGHRQQHTERAVGSGGLSGTARGVVRLAGRSVGARNMPLSRRGGWQALGRPHRGRRAGRCVLVLRRGQRNSAAC